MSKQAKKPYARIDYLNCNPDYDFTICPWGEVEAQIQISESNFTDIDEVAFDEMKNNSDLPEIKITLVMLTDKEFDKHFKKWDK